MAGLHAGVVLLLLSTVIATPTPQSPLGEAKAATRCGEREPVNETLSELMEDCFQWKLHKYPEWATLEVKFCPDQMYKVIGMSFVSSSLSFWLIHSECVSGVPRLQPPGGRFQHGRNPCKRGKVSRVPRSILYSWRPGQKRLHLCDAQEHI